MLSMVRRKNPLEIKKVRGYKNKGAKDSRIQRFKYLSLAVGSIILAKIYITSWLAAAISRPLECLVR